jgi:hypothetical protein
MATVEDDGDVLPPLGDFLEAEDFSDEPGSDDLESDDLESEFSEVDSDGDGGGGTTTPSPHVHRGHEGASHRRDASITTPPVVYSSAPRRHVQRLPETDWVREGARQGDIMEEFDGQAVFHLEQKTEWTNMASRIRSRVVPAQPAAIPPQPTVQRPDPTAEAQETFANGNALAGRGKPKPLRPTGTVPGAGSPDVSFMDQAEFVEDLEMRMRVQQQREGSSVRMSCNGMCSVLVCVWPVLLHVALTAFVILLCCRASSGLGRRPNVGRGILPHRHSGCASVMPLHLHDTGLGRTQTSLGSNQRWRARGASLNTPTS